MRGNTENVQEGEMSKPVPPPRPDGREVCEKEEGGREGSRSGGVLGCNPGLSEREELK